MVTCMVNSKGTPKVCTSHLVFLCRGTCFWVLDPHHNIGSDCDVPVHTMLSYKPKSNWRFVTYQSRTTSGHESAWEVDVATLDGAEQ